MRIEGRIIDKKTGRDIAGTVTAIAKDGTLIGTTSIAAGENYFLEGTEDYLTNATLITVSPGYTMLKVLGDWLTVDGNIYLERDNTATMVLAGAAGLALIASTRKKKGRKVGNAAAIPMVIQTAKTIPTPVLVGAGVVGFFVLKSILEKLGIWKDKNDRALDNLSTSTSSFWNPNFWQTKPANVSYTQPIDAATAIAWCREIQSALGWFDDKEETVKAIFKRCHSQATASFLAYYFNKQYSEDLLTTLIGGWWPYDGLSDSDVVEITNYVNNLPKY